MEISLIDNSSIVKINEISFDFISAPSDFLVSESGGYYYVNLRKNIPATIFAEEDMVNIIISKHNTYSSLFSVAVDYDFISQEDETTFIISKNNNDYILKTNKCLIKIDGDNFLITVQDQVASIIVYSQAKFQTLGFKSLTVDPFVIDDSTYMPEFSVACFDDSSFTKPRPIRQGIPVVSTVPSLVDNSSSQEDKDYYDLGKGPISKTLHFRIICNKVLETSLSANAVSTKLRLKVYLPNGLDTVKDPIYKTVNFSSNDTTNNVSYYYASHTFYAQGIHNNIEYVDGIMFVDVDASFTIQDSMPLQFDFTL
jgi:hypothetical protein